MATTHPTRPTATTPASTESGVYGQPGQYGAPSAPRQTLRTTTAPAPKATDSAAFLARCQELAQATGRHADEAVYAGRDTRHGGVDRYRVASSNTAGLVYQVTHTLASDLWRCNCPAGSTWHPCKHTGVAYAAYTATPPAPAPSTREQVRAGLERELRQRIASLQRQASDMSDDIATLVNTWNDLFDRGVVSAETLARLDASISHEQARRRNLITRLQSERAQLAALALESAPLALV